MIDDFMGNDKLSLHKKISTHNNLVTMHTLAALIFVLPLATPFSFNVSHVDPMYKSETDNFFSSFSL